MRHNFYTYSRLANPDPKPTENLSDVQEKTIPLTIQDLDGKIIHFGSSHKLSANVYKNNGVLARHCMCA